MKFRFCTPNRIAFLFGESLKNQFMNDQHYFPPPTTSSIGPWMQNFVTEFGPIYTEFDITLEAYEALQADNTALQFILERYDKYNEVNSLYINTRNILWSGDPDNPLLDLIVYPKQPVVVTPMPAQVAPNLYARTKALVLLLRQHPKMTETTARTLGILPKPSADPMPPDYTPVLSGSVMNGQVTLDCPVRGFAGYEVWRSIGNSGEYTRLDVSVGRIYTDKTPLPNGSTAELRNYRVRMLDSNNQPSGQYSNIVTLTASLAI